jgi:hypothetical protein
MRPAAAVKETHIGNLKRLSTLEKKEAPVFVSALL